MSEHQHKVEIPVQAVFKRRVQPDAVISKADIEQLMAFKASEKKDSPERLQGIYGPYEELIIRKTGRLPDGFYEAGDPEPWGLRIEESRSNILWQVTSGMMDSFPDFGGAYMALALDHGLGDADYVRELKQLNKDWGGYLDHSRIFTDHKHKPMGHIYHSVVCPACSVLTAMASQNEAMISVFKEMTGLKPADRVEFLRERQLLSYLNMMIPDVEQKP